MRNLLCGALALTMITGAALADASSPLLRISAPVPLNQVDNPPDRVATARVTDADGTVIGAVQKVELRNGKPTHVDVALLGSDNTVTLDAATVRYDSGTNVVDAGQSASQLMAHPKN
jgi:hypothetical protein